MEAKRRGAQGRPSPVLHHEPRHTRHRAARGLVAIIIFIGATVLGPVPAALSAPGGVYRFDIGRTTLDIALRELARQGEFQIARFSDVAPAGTIVGPLSGDLTRVQALTLLLRDTGLSYRPIDDRTVAIVPLSRTARVPDDSMGGKALKKKAPVWSGIATLAGLCGAIAPGVACAQAQAQVPAADEGELQEVVITAERRPADIQTTPIAISAISGEALQRAQQNTLSALQSSVPSFQVNDSGIYNFINIRGVGNSFTNPAETTGVAVYRDGMLQSETVGQGAPFYDIQNVEVLRGPQGTFVGASSTGGAVNINSVNPNFRGINGYAEGQLGNYSEARLDGAVNLPVSDTLAMRIAFYGENRGSFYSNVGGLVTPDDRGPINDPGKVATRAGRVSLLWKPNDALEVLGKLEYYYSDTDGLPGNLNPNTFTTLFTAGNLAGIIPSACNFGPDNSVVCPQPGTVTHAPYFANYSGSPFVLNYGMPLVNRFTEKQQRYLLEARYTLPDGIVLRSLSGYQRLDQQGASNASWNSANAGASYALTPRDAYYSQEVNVISPATGRFNWIVGAYWYYRNTPLYYSTYNVPFPNEPTTPISTRTSVGFVSANRIMAAFGQANWQMLDTLQLQVGVRENWDNNFVRDDPPGANGVFLYGVPPPGNLIVPISTAGHYKDSVPTGKVGLNWAPWEDQFFYAFYARGYKTGGVNSGSPDHPSYDPEHVNDYEVGWKGRLLDGHVHVQLGGYWMNYQAMQYPIFNVNDPAFGVETVNLAPSTIKGIEFQLQAQYGGLGINLNVAYSKSSLGTVTAVPEHRLPPLFAPNTIIVPYAQCPGSPVGPPCFDYGPYKETVGGESLPFAPELTANVDVSYGIRVGGGVLRPRVTYSHTGQQWQSIWRDSNYFLMQSRDLLGANLDYEAGPWLVDVYGTNLTNQTYIIGSSNPPTYYGAPRQYGVRLMRTF